MNRYVDCTENVIALFNRVISERFPVHANTNFKLLFDNKKRVRGGKVTLASIETTNDKTRFLTATDGLPEGADYIIIIDMVAWDNSTDVDRKRILSHEMRHAFIDEKGKFKIIEHDIEDFVAEIKLNEDKPEWAKSLVALTSAIYDQRADDKADQRG